MLSSYTPYSYQRHNEAIRTTASDSFFTELPLAPELLPWCLLAVATSLVHVPAVAIATTVAMLRLPGEVAVAVAAAPETATSFVPTKAAVTTFPFVVYNVALS